MRRTEERYTLERSGDRPHAGRLNALRHGLRASSLLLPDESAISYGLLASRLHHDLQPVGAIEALLVDHILKATWRLRRCDAVEVGLFTYHAEHGWGKTEETRPAVQLAQALVRDYKADAFSKLHRYRTAAERAVLRCLRELRACQAERRRAERGRLAGDSEVIDVSPVRDVSVPTPTKGKKSNGG